MPLYGVEGLAPVLTSVSADGRAVQTLYRLESGELIELTQSRGAGDRRPFGAPSVSVETAARGLVPTTARGAVLSDAAPVAPFTWTTTRGDIRVMMRTTAPTADLDALGARLRVD